MWSRVSLKPHMHNLPPCHPSSLSHFCFTSAASLSLSLPLTLLPSPSLFLPSLPHFTSLFIPVPPLLLPPSLPPSLPPQFTTGIILLMFLTFAAGIYGFLRRPDVVSQTQNILYTCINTAICPSLTLIFAFYSLT